MEGKSITYAHKLHFIRLLVWPSTRGTTEKKYLMSAVGLDLFSRSLPGSSMSSMSIIELSAGGPGACDESCLDDGDVFAFLDTGASMASPSEVVGETMITLSRESVLLITSERHLLKV